MATVPIALGSGKLPDSPTTLYTNSGSNPVIFTHVSVINNSGNPDLRFWLTVNRGAGDVLVVSGVLEEQYVSIERFPNIVLEGGHSISGYADSASSVDYVLDGVQFS